MAETLSSTLMSMQGVWLRHSLVPSLRGMPGMEAKLEKGCKVQPLLSFSLAPGVLGSCLLASCPFPPLPLHQVADVGCGCGEALLTVAAAFPSSTFHGYDISEDALR